MHEIVGLSNLQVPLGGKHPAFPCTNLLVINILCPFSYPILIFWNVTMGSSFPLTLNILLKVTNLLHACMHACKVASVMSEPLRPHGLQPARLLCPWGSPGKNTGVDCHAHLPGIFLTQGSNPSPLGLLHWWASSLPLAPTRKAWLIHQVTANNNLLTSEAFLSFYDLRWEVLSLSLLC